MNTRLKLLLAAGAAFALAGPAAAQQATHAPVPATDKQFMVKAAQGGLGEVALGHLAQSRGSSVGAKRFGRQMVMDHTKANAVLMRVAASKGVTLPAAPGPEEQAVKARLSGLSGAAFDKAYISDMVEDHEQDVAEFTKEARTGKDPAVKAFAAKTLPTLRMHLQMARALNSAAKHK